MPLPGFILQMMFRILFLVPVFLFSGLPLRAAHSLPASEILHELKKLNTVATVMYIAAHPDDENTRLLSWLANEKRVRTVYLSLTRGDGGQNLIGSEQGEMLGLIRTEELLAARRTDGAEQCFSSALDFGYSKNPEETFRFWDREKVLADVVFAIRRYKPDIIICRFPSTGEGGHGHHTASAILAEQAFDMAGDPAKFPEQLMQTEVWQPLRLLWNTFNFGGNNTTSPDQLQVDVGGYNPLLGKSYGEIAALSRSCHKSQGFGSALQRGSQTEFFKLIKGRPCSKDIFEGINTSWSRLQNSKDIQTRLNAIIRGFSSADPAASVPAMVELYAVFRNRINQKQVLSPADGYQYQVLRIAIQRLKTIIAASAGLWLETTAADYRLIQGQSYTLNAQVLLRSRVSVALEHVYVLGEELLPDSMRSVRLVQDKPIAISRKSILKPQLDYSMPYWLDKSAKNRKQVFALQPDMPVSEWWQMAEYILTINGEVFNYTLPLSHKSVDPVKGELHRPLEVLPDVTVTPSENNLVLCSNKPYTLQYRIRANRDGIKGRFFLSGAQGCRYKDSASEFSLSQKGDEVLIEVEISACEEGYEGFLEGHAEVDGKDFTLGIREFAYEHIPKRFVLFDNEVRIRRISVQTGITRVAYIAGAGDQVSVCLKQLGMEVSMLKPEDLPLTDLSRYDAIVTGVRAYNTSETLVKNQKFLLDYVEKGGRLLVQYNTNSRVGPLQTEIGPYKFNISRNRVTDENSEFEFISDTIRVLNLPNKITAEDFKGWVQERGVYFATEQDSAYACVLKLKDPGENWQNGSILMAPYGKGYFVYTGLSFFRQLPAGVPGAFRLFVNLISQPLKP